MNLKPKPSDIVGCVECHTVFEMPEPAHDVLYVPTCPTCDTVVDGYQDRANMKEKHKEACRVCNHIENELSKLVDQTDNMRKGVPEGGGFEALEHAAERLSYLSKMATEEYEDLTDSEL